MTIIGAPLPFVFGGLLVAEELLEIEGTPLAYIESHCELGKDLLLPEFQNKPRLGALLCGLLEGVQDAEDAVWSVLVGRWLDSAIGVQLDHIGDLVDLPRQGWLDEAYRKLLSAQILTLRSSSTWPDMFAVLGALGHDVELAAAYEHHPAALRLVAGDPPNGPSGEDEFNMLDRARGAGIRLIYEVPAAAVEDTFMWADADVAQSDSARGWADDAATTGGVWADSYASTESN